MKRGYLFHRPRGADMARTLTWRAELTWRVGLARMRRVTKACGRAAHGPREAQVAWTRGRRPRGSTWMPVRGATWQGVGRWRAHGLVGPGKYIEAVTQMLTAPLHFIRANSIFLFRVGLGSRRIDPLRVTWHLGGRRIRSRDVDRVDPSPPDRDQNTCIKSNLSEIDLPITWRRVDASGASDLHRTGEESGWCGTCSVLHYYTYACNRDRPTYLIRSDGWSCAKDFHAIAARSPCDRGLIEPRSWLLHGAIVAHDQLILVGHDCPEIVATNRRLFPDQTAEIFERKSPLKTDVFLLIS